MSDPQLGQLVTLRTATDDLSGPTLDGVDREGDRPQGQLVLIPALHSPLCALTSDPFDTRSVVLIIRGGEANDRPFALLVPAHPARNNRARHVGAVNLAATPAAPLLKGRVLVPIDRAACRTRFLSVIHPTARILGRPRPPHGPARLITAAHDRLTADLRLLDQSGVRPCTDRRRDPFATVADDLSPHGPGGKQPADNTLRFADPHPLGLKLVRIAQIRTPAAPDVAGHQQTVLGAHHTGPRRQRHQHRTHQHSLNDRA